MRKSNYDKRPTTTVNGPSWNGWKEIVNELSQTKQLLAVECYQGVFVDEVINALCSLGIVVTDTRDCFKSEADIRNMTDSWMTDDRLFGRRMGHLKMEDFLATDSLSPVTADRQTAGYAVSVTSSEGYDGDVTLSVGIDPEGRITSVSFTELHETPGKGMLCDEPAFKDQFSGRSVDAFKLLPSGGGSADNEIDGVSGATVTSKAVVNAVNAALYFYRKVIRG